MKKPPHRHLTTGLVLLSCISWISSARADEGASQQIYKALFSGARISDAKQKRSRASTSVMGVRGLTADGEVEKKTMAVPDIRSVYKMEDRQPNALLVRKIREQLTAVGNTAAQRDPSMRPPFLAPTAEELKNEIALGRKMAAQILGAHPPLSNEKVQEYVTALTEVIVQTGLGSPRPFKVSVLDTEQINAFACPGGYVFITKGAVRATASQAQLAALIGHELAHVSQRHLLSSMRRRIEGKKPTVGENPAELNPHLQMRKRVRPEAGGAESALAQVLGPKGVGLTVLQASSEALEMLLSDGLEREFEFEADSLGTRLITASGFPSDSLSRFLEQLSRREHTITGNPLKTHPPFEIRLQNLAGLIAKLPAFPGSNKTESDAFTEAKLELEKQ